MQAIDNMPGYVFSVSQQLIVKSCPTCSIPYAIPERLDEHANNCPSGDVSWSCPMGHVVVKTKSERDKLADELRRTKEGKTWLHDQLQAASADAEHQRARANGYKGAMTQAKHRAAKGVCPVSGCHRHFVDVQRHIASKHPNWQERNGTD